MNNQKKRIQGNDKTVNSSQISEYEYLIKHDLKSLKYVLEKEKYSVWVVKYGQAKAKELIKELILTIADKISYRRIESKFDLFDWAVTTFKLDSHAPVVQNTTIIKRQNNIQKQTIIPQQNNHKTFNYHNDYKVKNDNRMTETNNTNNQFTLVKTESPKKKKNKNGRTKIKKKQKAKKILLKAKKKKGEREHIPNKIYTDEIIGMFWTMMKDGKTQSITYDDLQKEYKSNAQVKWGSFDSFIRQARKWRASKK